jgi:hypothetical protein
MVEDETIRLLPLQPIVVQVNDYEISIKFNSISAISTTEAKLTQRASIVFSFKEEKPLEECKSLVQKVGNFLTLAMDMRTYVLEFTGKTSFNEEEYEKGGETKKHSPLVKINYETSEWVTRNRKLNSSTMLFPFSRVEGNLQTILTNWINKADVLAPVYNLFFATQFNHQLYLEVSFLHYVQALETYHRQQFGGKFQEDKEYKKGLYQLFKDVIPDNIDEDFKSSLLTGALKYAHQYSLRKRLKELFTEIGVGFFSESERVNSFIDDVSNTRNYLTHYPPALKEKAASGKELYKLTEQLACIIGMCLLYESGLSWEEIWLIIKANHHYKNLLT